MNRSRGFAEAAPAVRFSDVPADVVQNVQIAQAQGRAMSSAPPAAGKQVYFSDAPPDVTQAVQAVATASAMAAA